MYIKQEYVISQNTDMSHLICSQREIERDETSACRNPPQKIAQLFPLSFDLSSFLVLCLLLQVQQLSLTRRYTKGWRSQYSKASIQKASGFLKSAQQTSMQTNQHPKLWELEANKCLPCSHSITCN